MVYSMAFKGERSVAAISTMAEAMPPHWNSYITTHALDETVERWQQQGGTVIMPPYKVMEAGHMAAVQDPTGVTVSLWQPAGHIGAGLVNEVNTFCWAELQTRGSEQAAQFYKDVFGWELDIEEKPPHYITASVAGHLNCGIFDMDKIQLPPAVPSRWAVYFNVANLDDALAQVRETGGQVVTETMEIEPGRFATITDPQGAAVTLMQIYDPDD